MKKVNLLSLNPEQRNTKLGALGEEWVKKFLEKLSFSVTMAVSKWDSVKDMEATFTPSSPTLNVEVKTQTPWFQFNAMTFRTDQLRKILGADMVFFVNAGNGQYKDAHEGAIYQLIPSSNMQFPIHHTKDGRDMHCVNRNVLEIVDTLPPEIIMEMRKYTMSDFRG